jgi:hypothetical protein
LEGSGPESPLQLSWNVGRPSTHLVGYVSGKVLNLGRTQLDTNLNNPSGNVLPQGLDSELLETAVKLSGYPLQTAVAVELQKHFNVIEEWGFVDRETGTKRSLDLFAYKPLTEKALEANNRSNPVLTLLVECKRSDLPFVFFKSVTQREIPGFPAVHGLTSKRVEVIEGNTLSYKYVSQYLDLLEHSFVSSDVIVCNTFCKASRKGKELELSGTEPFNNIVLPLISALEHSFAYYKAQHKDQAKYPSLTLGICVLDAPMIVADATKTDNALTLTPWIRVIRQEAPIDPRNERNYEHHAIDIVHSGFLTTFIEQHVIPFADFFCDRILNRLT